MDNPIKAEHSNPQGSDQCPASASSNTKDSPSQPPLPCYVVARLSEFIRTLNEDCNFIHFRYPVDVERYSCPDYYQVITNPMDLQTIQKRLDSDFYTAVGDVAADVELVLSNCRRYNTAPSMKGLIRLCKRAQRVFAKAWAAVLVDLGLPTSSLAQNPSLPQCATPPVDETLTTPTIPLHEKTPCSLSNTQTQPPQDNLQGAGPRPPASTGATTRGDSDGERTAWEQVCFCILQRLRKLPQAFLFEQPVVSNSDLPLEVRHRYKTVIANPMDYQTVEERLESHSFQTMQEAHDAFTLVYHNCCKFNPNEGANKWIHHAAVTTQKKFEAIWAESWLKFPSTDYKWHNCAAHVAPLKNESSATLAVSASASVAPVIIRGLTEPVLPHSVARDAVIPKRPRKKPRVCKQLPFVMEAGSAAPRNTTAMRVTGGLDASGQTIVEPTDATGSLENGARQVTTEAASSLDSGCEPVRLQIGLSASSGNTGYAGLSEESQAIRDATSNLPPETSDCDAVSKLCGPASYHSVTEPDRVLLASRDEARRSGVAGDITILWHASRRGTKRARRTGLGGIEDEHHDWTCDMLEERFGARWAEQADEWRRRILSMVEPPLDSKSPRVAQDESKSATSYCDQRPRIVINQSFIRRASVPP